MNRKEPYIGMPIILGGYEEETAACCPVEIRPQPPETPELDQTLALAMAYVPWQKWETTYDFETGLDRGTIFPNLDFPFRGYRGGMGR